MATPARSTPMPSPWPKSLGLTVHVFEEGYLRPHWVTYERGGSNGHSRLMQLTLDQMQPALAHSDMDLPDAPARWGDMRQHMFYGALYHWFVLTGFWDYRSYRPHRALTVWQEFRLYMQTPDHAAVSHHRERFAATFPHQTRRLSLSSGSCCNWNMTAAFRCTRLFPP